MDQMPHAPNSQEHRFISCIQKQTDVSPRPDFHGLKTDRKETAIKQSRLSLGGQRTDRQFLGAQISVVTFCRCKHVGDSIESPRKLSSYFIICDDFQRHSN